ncbi:MAG: TonB-dependent receptor [Bacteroidetes bacterium]|nr:TonB-dependent receptor [Bacteroidota bacterium]
MKHRLALLILILTGQVLLAQDKPMPPPRDFKPETKEARDVLPALTLPEYVITGSDMISFTEDRKSGATAPDSKEFTARAGRGKREQRFFDTSPTHMPLRLAELTGSDEVFRLRAGLGTFSTPLFEAWYADRYHLGDAAAHMAYERSNGHVAHADYSRFNFDVAGGTYLPRDLTPFLASSRVQGDVEIEAEDFGLYADKMTRHDPTLDFRRNALGFSAGIDVISRRNAIVDHDLRLFFSHYAIEEALAVRDTLPLEEYQQIENRFGLEGNVKTMIERQSIRFGLRLHVNDLTESAATASRPFFLRTDGMTVFALSERLKLHTSAALFLYRGSDQASQVRLYPSLELRHLLSDDWSLFAGWIPNVEERTLHGFLRQNPYLMLASTVRHTDMPLRFEAGASFDNRGQSSARVSLEYLSSRSWPRFALLPDPIQQQWEMRYDGSASVFNIRADIAHAFSAETRIHADILLRTSAIGEDNSRIPYMPDYEARVLLRHDFPFALSVQSTVQLVGEQEADGGALPAWMLLGLELEYRVVRNFGLFLRFDNLLDQGWQRWPGYRERPFFMMGGITAHF